MTALGSWAHDLGLGVRLAVSGRGGLVRLALVAVGVGMGVAVLLLTVSLVNVDEARNARENARIMLSDEFGTERAGPAQLLAQHAGSEFRGEWIRGDLLDPVVPAPDLPPGLDRIPGPSEVYLSPALADLLASADGELLRPRFPWTVAGTVGNDGLVDPNDMLYYAGAELSTEMVPPDLTSGYGANVFQVYGFGEEPERQPASTFQVLLALSGGLLLLIPVFILVGAATRIAAAARERRLAALRLVGADVSQTGRIATGEALAGSVVGLLIGAGVFVAVTPLAEHVTLFGMGSFRADLRPSVFGVALIAVFVPTLAVVAGLVALRHTFTQPLGATRKALPPRRRLWWRLAPLLVGVAILIPLAGAGAEEPSLPVQLAVLGGLALIGISVPLLLPWLLQRAVSPLAGGPPSWQLAIRRIQLDSGTPARAAAGLAALLTVAVAIQTLVVTGLPDSSWEPDHDEDRVVDVYAGAAMPTDSTLTGLAAVEGVRESHPYRETYADIGGDHSQVAVRIGGCAELAVFAHIERCTDGDVFVPADGGPVAGQELTFSRWDDDDEFPTEIGRWTVPDDAQSVVLRQEATPDGVRSISFDGVTVLVTPAAQPEKVPLDMGLTRARLLVDPADPDVIERVRNALVPVDGAGASYRFEASDDGYVLQLRNALLAGSLIVLALAAASMLIVSIEQVRERRQQLAALAAAGVSGRTLAAAVLWQALLPFAVAAVAAITVGIGLASLFLRVFDIPVGIDWAGVGLLTGACALAVLAVTALTLPSLRAAARPESLRTE